MWEHHVFAHECHTHSPLKKIIIRSFMVYVFMLCLNYESELNFSAIIPGL